MILDKNIKAEEIFFSDKSKIELGSFTGDLIRLDSQKKLFDKNRYNLINCHQKNSKNLS